MAVNHYLDSLRFYYIARGSLNEVLSAFITCDTVCLLTGELPRQRELCHSALRALNGYIRYVRGSVKVIKNMASAWCTKTVQPTASCLKDSTPTNLPIYHSTNLPPHTHFRRIPNDQ